MKNFIFLHYNIYIDKIYLNKRNKYFYYNNKKIYIIEYSGEVNYLKELFYLCVTISKKGFCIDQFIFNNDGLFYTKKDSFYVILLEDNSKPELSIDTFNYFFNIHSNLKQINIVEEWEKEVDAIEKEIIEYNDEFKNVKKSVDYFIGLAENAIQLMMKIKVISYDSIGHIIDYNLFNERVISNPFLFIKTNKMYDISNYIKFRFYTNTLNLEELEEVIKKNSVDDNIYLYSSLMYPNLYFDLIKKIILLEEPEEKISIFISNIERYDRLLLYLQKKMNNVNEIKQINWLRE